MKAVVVAKSLQDRGIVYSRTPEGYSWQQRCQTPRARHYQDWKYRIERLRRGDLGAARDGIGWARRGSEGGWAIECTPQLRACGESRRGESAGHVSIPCRPRLHVFLCRYAMHSSAHPPSLFSACGVEHRSPTNGRLADCHGHKQSAPTGRGAQSTTRASRLSLVVAQIRGWD